MAQRNVIEETFRVIAPSRRRGIPKPPAIAAGIDGSGGDFNASLSQAAQEIGQLRAAWQQQAALIAANTSALQSNAKGGGSAVGTAGQVASGLFGGALGFLSPVAKGLLGLFGGGGGAAPVSLPSYVPPPPVSITGVVRSPSPGSDNSSQTTREAAPAPNGQIMRLSLSRRAT